MSAQTSTGTRLSCSVRSNLGRLFHEVILFADCCRTIATAANPYRMQMTIESSVQHQVHFYCLGCVNGEVVEEHWSEDGVPRGVFSETLLRALDGREAGAIDANGRVTAYSLATYLRKKPMSLRPDFDPNDDAILRKIVLARGFPPRRWPLEIRLKDPSQTFGLFDRDLRRLNIRREQIAEDRFRIERDSYELIIVTRPDVIDISAASAKEAVLPTESTALI